MEISDAAVNASYLIGKEIAVASKTFCDGQFPKKCLLKATKIMHRKKRQFLLI